MGYAVFVEERTVDVHIRRLRAALEPVRMDPLIQTVVAVVTVFQPVRGHFAGFLVQSNFAGRVRRPRGVAISGIFSAVIAFLFMLACCSR